MEPTSEIPELERQTVRWAPWIYGPDGVPSLDDPTECFHEVTKIYPSTLGRQTAGARRLERSPELLRSTTRAGKRFAHLPAVALSQAALPDVPLSVAIRDRRSDRDFGDAPLTYEHLSALLRAGYGLTHDLRSASGDVLQPLRAVPSGGALYPLDVYAVLLNVERPAPGLYHYDPTRDVLETLRVDDLTEALAAATTYPELIRPAGAVLIVAASFWRTRFKYGPRGYRFALLEAGHLAQNVLLVAAALQLNVVPLGGFFDRRVEELLDLDGVHEAALYALSLGSRGGEEGP